MAVALKFALIPLLGLAGGLFVGVGAAALLTLLDMPGRFAIYAGGKDRLRLMAFSCFAGLAMGLAAYLFKFSAKLPPVFSAAFGALSGIFVGILACALAETLEALPVLAAGRWSKAMRVCLYAMALGKCLFSAFDLLFIK